VAPSAPPTPFETASGSSSSNLVAERMFRDLPSWSSCLFRVLGLRLRPLARSPTRPLQEGAEPFLSPAGLPLLGFLLPRTRLRRVPLLRRGLPFGRPRGTGVAKLPSVPSSGFLPLSTVPASTRLARGLATPPFAVAPDASRPSFMPLASLELPSRAFPSRGSVPALAGRFFLAGFAFDCRRRRACETFAVAFAASRQLFALEPTRRRTLDA